MWANDTGLWSPRMSFSEFIVRFATEDDYLVVIKDVDRNYNTIELCAMHWPKWNNYHLEWDDKTTISWKMALDEVEPLLNDVLRRFSPNPSEMTVAANGAFIMRMQGGWVDPTDVECWDPEFMADVTLSLLAMAVMADVDGIIDQWPIELEKQTEHLE